MRRRSFLQALPFALMGSAPAAVIVFKGRAVGPTTTARAPLPFQQNYTGSPQWAPIEVPRGDAAGAAMDAFLRAVAADYQIPVDILLGKAPTT